MKYQNIFLTDFAPKGVCEKFIQKNVIIDFGLVQTTAPLQPKYIFVCFLSILKITPAVKQPGSLA